MNLQLLTALIYLNLLNSIRIPHFPYYMVKTIDIKINIFPDFSAKAYVVDTYEKCL